MAFDEKVARRVRTILKNRVDIAEKEMFGGIAFLVNGNMFCGINDGDVLMLRLGEEMATASLEKPHVRPMDFTGRPLKSYVYVASAGYKTAAQLNFWINLSLKFVGKLPRKKK